MSDIARPSGRVVLVLDGHDGSGKTTLVRRLATAMGTPYVQPFAGKAGLRLLDDADAGRYGDLSCAALQMVERALGSVAGPLVLSDRHWMTVFTLLPESYWQPWMPLPPTLLCSAGLPVTLQRLGTRDEPPADVAEHARYIAAYRLLADRFGCETVRTDLLTEDASFDVAHRWANQNLAAARCPQ
ncbi:MAG TPA: hypothetical protein VF381_10450 [Thermoanaerobaculia bacterium]